MALLINRNQSNQNRDESILSDNSTEINKSELLSIGEMARFCSISTKSLRHYDKKGILIPSVVDPETGYRYYSKDQLFWLVMIKRLKKRNFSLSEVKKHLETQDIKQLDQIYQSKELEIDREIQKLKNIKEMISIKRKFFHQYLKNPDIKNCQFEIVNMPDRKILFLKSKDYFNIQTLAVNLSSLSNLAEKHNYKTEGLWMSVFHDDYSRSLETKLNFETCISVESENRNSKHIRTIPQGNYAVVCHTGSRKQSIEEYKNLLKFIKDSKFQIDGPLIKIYRISYAHSKSYDSVTSELQIKVK